MRDGGFLGLGSLGVSVSNYLECDCSGRVVVVMVMVAAAADSKDQRPGAELDSQRRNLQVCNVQVQGCAGRPKTQQSRAAWS